MLRQTARRFISAIEAWYLTTVRGINMVIIDLGYRSVVLHAEDAVRVAEILARGETFEEKYRTQAEKDKSGIDTDYTYHVYPQDKPFNMRVMPDSQYQMAKLAGKPEKA